MADEITGKNNAFFRQLLYIGILITIGLVILKQLEFFVGSFLGAITIYVVLRTTLFALTERRKWRPWIASLMLVLATTLVLSGLGFLIFEVIASEIPNVDTSKIVDVFNELLRRVNGLLGFTIVPENIIKNSGGTITKVASMLLNTTYSFAANVFMMLVILYFMLLRGRVMERYVNEYLPFRGHSLQVIRQEFKNIIYSNAIGIPLVMFAQAVASCLVYWVLGVNNAIFWAFMTAICGLIPMVGTTIVTIPMGIYMIFDDNVWLGIAMIACGLLIVANVDNVCRIILMKKITNTHPLIVIFGVILGIPLFGFWGIIFGPLLISGFLLLIRIYYREYKLLPPEKPDVQ